MDAERLKLAQAQAALVRPQRYGDVSHLCATPQGLNYCGAPTNPMGTFCPGSWSGRPANRPSPTVWGTETSCLVCSILAAEDFPHWQPVLAFALEGSARAR